MKNYQRHQRCPWCGSLNTKRHGRKKLRRRRSNRSTLYRQRWYCKACNRTFSSGAESDSKAVPDTNDFDARAVTMYFDRGASYRGVGRELSIDPMTAYTHIAQLAQNCKAPWEVNLELKPTWSGYLIVDGDAIRVKDHREFLLLGVDTYSQDIPHAILAEHENGQNWTHFLVMMRSPIHYPFKGLTSDGDPALQEAIMAVCPDVPYQLCVRHYEKQLQRYLRYELCLSSRWRQEQQRFLSAVHNMLYADSMSLAQKYRDVISIDPGFKKAGLGELITTMNSKFADLTRYHLHPGIPRTTNIAEGVISRLDYKITAGKSYKSHTTAWATLKMLIMYLRFKKFTDCQRKNRFKNGQSPLQLAGVNVSNLNWITFSQKPK
jgi:transposase-like protein